MVVLREGVLELGKLLVDLELRESVDQGALLVAEIGIVDDGQKLAGRLDLPETEL